MVFGRITLENVPTESYPNVCSFRFYSTRFASSYQMRLPIFQNPKACISLKTASHNKLCLFKTKCCGGNARIVSSYSPYPFNVTLAHLGKPNCIHAWNHALKLFRLDSQHGLVWFVTEMEFSVLFQCTDDAFKISMNKSVGKQFTFLCFVCMNFDTILRKTWILISLSSKRHSNC